MAGSILEITEILQPDDIARSIARMWFDWNQLRDDMLQERQEVRQYLFSTDTRTTANSHLPWRNTTHIPKLTQIRDNLVANYLAVLFPRRDWQVWEGDSEEDDGASKREAIESYMKHAVEKGGFKGVIENLIYDYLEGDCFAMPAWKDDRTSLSKYGYVGPVAKRVSPLDIVFNPTAPDFASSPKIIRKIVTMGELQREIEQITDDHNRELAQEAFDYIRETRGKVLQAQGRINFDRLDDLYEVSGLNSWQQHLNSQYIELLYFYGDFYDIENEKLLKNHEIVVADKDKVLSMREDVTFFDSAPIYKSGWRKRPDSLWSMGAFDNLLGLQYRINHLENAKADMVDLTVVPPLKIRGMVEDFQWGPAERIYVGDDGDVDMMQINSQALSLDTQIERYIQLMETMAGAPREAMGFRSPGEKTKYEVQRLENAASRIFQQKITQFENEIVEPLLNAMLELARRNVTEEIVKVFDNELNVNAFIEVRGDNLVGVGKIKPVAAKHFAEQAQLVQDLNTFLSSPAGMDQEVIQHFSSFGLAKMFEELIGIDKFEVVSKNVRLSERTEAQTLAASLEEQASDIIRTPSGITEDDADEPFPV